MKYKQKEVKTMNDKINFKTFGKVLSYLKKYRFSIIVSLICILIGAYASVKSSMFFKTLIDEHIDVLLKSEYKIYLPLINALVELGIILFIGTICNYLSRMIMGIAAQGVTRDIRDEMFDKMEDLPIKYFDDNSHGNIMSRYTNDADTLGDMISESLPRLVNCIVTVVSILIAMISLNYILTIFVIIFTFLITLVTKKVASKSGKYFRLQQESIGKLNGYVEEMINGVKVVKVFNREERVIEDFTNINNLLRENTYKANKYANILMPLTGTLGNIEYVLVALIGAFISIKFNAGISVGTIASFLALVKGFNQPIGQISGQLNSIIMALAGASRIFEMMECEKEVDEGTVTLVNCTSNGEEIIETKDVNGFLAWKVPEHNGFRYVRLRGDIKFENVTFGYGEKKVLHDVSLEAKRGEKIAFVGSTGAGKTTIINLLNRFYDIDEGVIYYDGIDIKDIKKKDLRKSLGMVLQDTNLFTGTIKENIKYGRIGASDEEVIEACKLANADFFIRNLPNGYDTVLDGNGANLSQGQRQLLAIARAAISKAPVMILDEATSSIDTRTEMMINDGMDKLMEGKTVFVIAHRLSTVQNADNIMVLEHGKIIEKGNHEELLKQKGEYYQLYTGAFELE